jgi:hypothetical protein
VSLINQSNSKLKTKKLDQFHWINEHGVGVLQIFDLSSPAQPNQKERKRNASHMFYKWLIRHA